MRRIKSWFRRLVWGSVGAVIAYLADPVEGRSRRARLRDQYGAELRRREREAERKLRYLASTAKGRAARPKVPVPPADDRALADRIRSEVLPHHDAGDVVVDVAEGVVTVRGQLASEARIRELASAIRQVPGVVSLTDLLHVPGTDAPNKEPSLRAAR